MQVAEAGVVESPAMTRRANERQRAILAELATDELTGGHGVSTLELARRLGWPKSTAAYHVGELARAGIVTVGIGRLAVVRLTRWGRLLAG